MLLVSFSPLPPSLISYFQNGMVFEVRMGRFKSISSGFGVIRFRVGLSLPGLAAEIFGSVPEADIWFGFGSVRVCKVQEKLIPVRLRVGLRSKAEIFGSVPGRLSIQTSEAEMFGSVSGRFVFAKFRRS
ncbi:hypothetical protein DCAR_0729332 [Daucus carota subsp. sativus]|uniref:Uncharacterized protein n=1 Tax=Daucus carota subsp. sativus TaxID=79200 RepID=A0A164U568_DAUCS|nr:hypothetical protein DCAR_0729332 [Daucus carota subsp. sativus]